MSAPLAAARAPEVRGGLAVARIEAPRLGCAAVARAFGDGLDWLWRDRDGDIVAGSGRLLAIEAAGPGRFAAIRDAAAELFSRSELPGLRLYGGFSFAPGGARGGEWRGFGEARFALPRVLYRAGRDGAELAVRYAEPGDPGGRRARAELEAISARLAGAASAGDERPPPSGVLRPAGGAAEPYRRLVAEARERIRGGAMAKVVAARRVHVPLQGTELPPLFAALEAAYPGCFLIAFRGEAGILVAASPERLVAARGPEVLTEALAGTASTERAATLHDSAKLQSEHQLTADHIAAALEAAGCAGLEIERPRIRWLPGLAHLETPIRARRRPGAHVLDLAAALHPTPAVAGLPTPAACRWIGEREGIDRGWYAGPVGWFDGGGDGELAVALRAGVLTGEGAWLYAGAGIVADSDPVAEWEETELKLGALRARLEVSEP